MDCEANVLCQLTQVKTDIARLFDRTNDINNILVQTSGWVVVTNEQELTTAIGQGKAILWEGPITLTTTLELDVDGVIILGKTDAFGNRAKAIRPHVSGNGGVIIMRVRATRVSVLNLEITSNHPLSSDTTDYDAAVYLDASDNTDVSDFLLSGCYIHHVAIGVQRNGQMDTMYADRIRIVNNFITSFFFYGVNLNWNTRDAMVAHNWIWGQNKAELHAGQTAPIINDVHTNSGNGIWIGNYAQRANILYNDVGYIGRNGIEYWDDIANTGEPNNDAKIIGNTIHNLNGAASMGISAFGSGRAVIGWNSINDVTGYGIELYNDIGINLGKLLVVGNTIRNIIGPVGAGFENAGISVNSCVGAMLYANEIANIRSDGANNSVGIKIIGGTGAGHPGFPGGRDITISGNKILDAALGIHLVGNGVDPYNLITILNNVMTLTSARKHNAAIESGILLDNITIAVVRDNILYHPIADPPVGLVDGFDLRFGGTVYSGDFINPPLVWAGASLSIQGSNLSIPY